MSIKYLESIDNPQTIITPIDASDRFPEILASCKHKYAEDISTFKQIVSNESSAADILREIRSNKYNKDQRMSLLKIFRRAVSPVLDTEMAKKITVVTTDSLVQALGHTFKPIELLKAQFAALSAIEEAALAALIGEYDKRGQLGYILTGYFFDWFEAKFHGVLTIDGPRGAGPDIELSSIFPEFKERYPCDFVIRSVRDQKLLAVGFARYDSTRGGGQSDDRTGGNSDKVSKAIEFCRASGESFRILFVSDGPGLAHNDTWLEACKLDGVWDGNVRVTTLKTADARVTLDWLIG